MEDLLRNLNGMQPGYVISNFKQENSFSSIRQFIEIRNERIFVFAVICLVNIWFHLTWSIV